MKSLFNAALLSSAALLSACGGGGSINTPGDGPNTGELQPILVTPEIFVASDGSRDFEYLPDPLRNNGAISGYIREHESCVLDICRDVAAYGETSSSSGTASYINSTESGYEAAVTFIERIGTTEVPASGTPSFSGDYSAIRYLETQGDPIYLDVILGDASLNANFDDMIISGTISSRVDEDDDSYENVTLMESKISGGAFGGTATGGELSDLPSSTSNGTYSGLLTGPTAGEAVGSVYLERLDDGQTFFERGIFIVESP